MKAKPTTKDLKTGTYVTRSIYNKVAEENKRLKRDIKTMLGKDLKEANRVKKIYKAEIKDYENFNALMTEMFKQVKDAK